MRSKYNHGGSGSTPDLTYQQHSPPTHHPPYSPTSPTTLIAQSPTTPVKQHLKSIRASSSVNSIQRANKPATLTTSSGYTDTGDLLQGFDQNSNRITQRPSTASPPPSALSLSDMEMRLRRLQEEYNRLSNSFSHYSQQTLDTCIHADGTISEVELKKLEQESDDFPSKFDLCRWLRGTGPKTDILYRRHLLSANEPITSPLFRLQRPATITELLGKYTPYIDKPIASFMDEHKSLDTFKPYVLSHANDLGSTPVAAHVNDRATQYLPPLAAEEYVAHVSRLTYFTRALHAIDIADPVFLSDPRTHLLLDLVMDLEAAFTLPRIDFLRRHAQTVQAMDTSFLSSSVDDDYQSLDRPRSNYVVGNGRIWLQGTPPTQSLVEDDLNADGVAEHIKMMTGAIPQHDGFRQSSASDSISIQGARNAQKESSTASCILGNKLLPDNLAKLAVVNNVGRPRSTNPFDPPLPDQNTRGVSNKIPSASSSRPQSLNPFDPPPNDNISIATRNSCRSLNPFDPPAIASTDTVSMNNSDLKQFGSQTTAVPEPTVEQPPQQEETEENISARYDPKLHPVVGPRSMEVSPTPPLYNVVSEKEGNASQKTLHSKGSGFSQRLWRKAVPVPHPLLPSPVPNE